MIGAIVGLLAGAGVLLVVAAVGGPRRSGRDEAPARVRRPSTRTIAWSAGSAAVAGLVAVAITAVPVVGLLAALAGATAPSLVGRRRRAAAARAVRASWPDAVDHLLSCVRAGLALPEAVADVGRTGPAPLRPAFARFADDYRVAGAFEPALENLRRELADPVADRVCAALLVARDVGGADLGVVLVTLSSMLREHDRIRGEVEGRQSWSVNAARLAVAAPWITLALLCTRPEAARAYSSTAGAYVVAGAAVLSVAAYLAMRRIGRLPADERLAR